MLCFNFSYRASIKKFLFGQKCGEKRLFFVRAINSKPFCCKVSQIDCFSCSSLRQIFGSVSVNCAKTSLFYQSFGQWAFQIVKNFKIKIKNFLKLKSYNFFCKWFFIRHFNLWGEVKTSQHVEGAAILYESCVCFYLLCKQSRLVFCNILIYLK